MAESKTARASRVQIGETKKDPFDTPEKKISELRKQREAGLFVNRVDFIDVLLAEYDKALTHSAWVEEANLSLKTSLDASNRTIDILTVENGGLVEKVLALETEALETAERTTDLLET